MSGWIFQGNYGGRFYGRDGGRPPEEAGGTFYVRGDSDRNNNTPVFIVRGAFGVRK